MIKRNTPIKKRSNLMRKRNRLLDKKMEVQGFDFFDRLIPGNTPTIDGTYVIYFDHVPPEAHSKVQQSAGVAIASFVNGSWGTSRTVKAYFGPIPVLSLEPLNTCTPPYLIGQSFYTGNLTDACQGYFNSGPFPQYILAVFKPGKEGDFIFAKTTEDVIPLPLSKYVVEPKGNLNWKVLSSKAQIKYQKHLRRLTDGYPPF